MAKQKFSHQENDLVLLELLKEDNRLAFHQLYHKYWEGLYNYVFNILRDKWSTEDVLHEIFTKVWIDRNSLEIKNLKSYLYVSVRNKALLKIRDAKFTFIEQQLIEELEIESEIEKSESYQELKNNVDVSIEKLPKRCKEIFYMNKFQHYSSAEIATYFNISQRTVENQLSLALKHLRNELGITLLLVLSANW